MQIEILGICGSPIKGGNTEVFLRESLKAAEAEGDVATQFITLAGKEIKGCRHCNWCVSKQDADRVCVQQDDMAAIYPALLRADALLLATPVYVGRLSGQLACFMDRFRAMLHGKVYHRTMRNKVGGALAVSWMRNAGLEITLMTLVSSFLMVEMIPVTASSSGPGSAFGSAGLSSIEGTGKFDAKDRLGVLHDGLGIKGAQALGKRLVEVTRLVKAGQISLGGTQSPGVPC